MKINAKLVLVLCGATAITTVIVGKSLMKGFMKFVYFSMVPGCEDTIKNQTTNT